MTQNSFQFGRRADDQLDLLRALVAQGKVEPTIAGSRLAELTDRARAGRAPGSPSRRWTDGAFRRAAAPAYPPGVPSVGLSGGASGVKARKADPERRQRLAAHIAATALPVRFAGTLQAPENPGEVPLVVVDGEKRPDVADLPRVFRVEALEGDARSRWLFVLDGRGGGCALLVVSVIRPVRCRFRLLFSFVHDRPLIEQVGRAGGFVMTCVDPTSERDRALLDAMFIAVPGADVLSVLASTRNRPS
jgi:hypothetical protein